LLASRSTTQNELLVRIAIFLTLVSASVVSLALVGQATEFDGRFDLFTLVLFSILLLVGTLTLLRVSNEGDEDLIHGVELALPSSVQGLSALVPRAVSTPRGVTPHRQRR
jgi:hypothetical protein